MARNQSTPWRVVAVKVLVTVCLAAVYVVIVVGLWSLLTSCALPADPCPVPPERHPEAWTEIRDTRSGLLLGYTCAGGAR